MASRDLILDNILRLEALFPEAVTEGQDAQGQGRKVVNMARLRELLGCEPSAASVEGSSPEAAPLREAYELNWVGKRQAKIQALTPSNMTLRPIRAASRSWETTGNLYIEGNNLDVLKLLQNSYQDRIRMIYIDPPYNTGSDFIYSDHLELSCEEYAAGIGLYSQDDRRTLALNLERQPRFHSAWCSMMYPLLVLSRRLLSQEGLIFISIDSNEVDNLKRMACEVFGADSFIADFPRVTKRGGKSTEAYAKNHDYVLAFAKNRRQVRIRGIAHSDEGFKYRDAYYEQRGPYKLNQTLDYNTLQYNRKMDYPITLEGRTFVPGGDPKQMAARHAGQHGKHDWVWRWSPELFEFGYKNGWIELSHTGRIYTKTYLGAGIGKSEQPGAKYFIEYKDRTKPLSTLEFVDSCYSNDNSNKELSSLLGSALFDYSKPTALIKRLLQTCTEPDSLVLDFFSGSATTGDAVMQQNLEDGGSRRYILVQLAEPCPGSGPAYKQGFGNICQLGQERLRRAGDRLQHRTSRLQEAPDSGFRVLRLDSSSLEEPGNTCESCSQESLASQVRNIKPDRAPEDLLFGCLLEWGLPLSVPYALEKLDELPFFVVQGGEYLACFAWAVTTKLVRALALRQPKSMVFRDECFSDSADKLNAAELFRLLSPNTQLKVL